MKVFEIKVTQIETEVPVTKEEYRSIGTDKSGKDKYGYVNHDTTETVQTVIYAQKMDELSVADLAVFLNQTQTIPPIVVSGSLTAPQAIRSKKWTTYKPHSKS